MLLTLSMLLNLLTAYIAKRRTGTVVNPFTAIMGMFALNGLFYAFSPLSESENDTSIPIRSTEIYVLVFSAGFAVLTYALLKPALFRLDTGLEIKPAGLPPLLTLCFGIVVAGTVMLVVRNNGSLPIMLMSEGFSAGRGSSYEDYYVPFVTPLTMGVSRFMFLILCLDYLTNQRTLLSHIRRNVFSYGLSAISALLVLGAGQRNVLFWPVAMFLFAFVRRNGFNVSRGVLTAVVTIAFALLFVLIGNYRFGSIRVDDSLLSGLVTVDVGNPIAQGMFNWIALYAGTSYPNLNAMIMIPPLPAYGLIALSETLPNVLLEPFVEVPQNAIIYLSSNGFLPYRGFTFRTAFADLIADFGYLGSLGVGLLLYSFALICYNRAGVSTKWFFLYLCFLPALLMFPFLNMFTGLPTLTALGLTPFFVKFQSKLEARHSTGSQADPA